MRSFQVFATMSPERALAVMRALSEEAPGVFNEAVAAACIALKARPVYLQRQPFEKRAEAVRRALSRVSANAVADEILAVYFLQCRKPLLVEWLDTLGIKHDDGALEENEPPAPPDKALEKAMAAFRGKDDDPDRELLLYAFAAQEAIQWQGLESQLAPLA